MKAGPELDAAVAELVFEIENVQVDENGAWYQTLCVLGPLLVSKYSTDWGAAGLVVERLIAKGYSFSLCYTSWFGGNKWDAIFDKEDDDWKEHGETGPHAISLAALEIPKAYPMICAWCGEIADWSPIEDSSAICPECVVRVFGKEGE